MSDFQNRLAKRKQEEARAAFAGYVQSVAFNMTLSRNMVDALWAVRQFGSAFSNGAKEAVPPVVASRSVPLMGALIRRGLVWHHYVEPLKAPEQHHYYKLTRAGELMCELLVEAGLIPASQPATRCKRARAIEGDER